MTNIPTNNDISKVFSEATGMLMIPAVENRGDYIETIWAMLNAYGYDETLKKLHTAFSAWINTRTKDGRPYSRLNLSWINYAMAGETPGKVEVTPDQRRSMEVESMTIRNR